MKINVGKNQIKCSPIVGKPVGCVIQTLMVGLKRLHFCFHKTGLCNKLFLLPLGQQRTLYFFLTVCKDEKETTVCENLADNGKCSKDPWTMTRECLKSCSNCKVDDTTGKLRKYYLQKHRNIDSFGAIGDYSRPLSTLVDITSANDVIKIASPRCLFKSIKRQ